MKNALEVRLVAGFALTLACIAAVPGDVGGCGETARPMNVPAFFAQKSRIDCQRCRECGLFSARCGHACDGRASEEERLPDGCAPLVHDAEVCLRALEAASCRDYAEFAADDSPLVPSECDFCPARDGG